MSKKEYLMQYDYLAGDRDKLWYIASRFSSLMEIDRVTGKVKEVLSLKKEGLYRSLIKDGNRLLLVPAKMGYLWIYDITDGKAKSQVLPDEIFCKGLNWSAKYIRLEKHVYFSWASPVIVKYNLSSGQWQLLTEWRKLFPRDCKYDNWFPNDSFFYDGFLYFQIGTSRMILKLNLNSDEFEVLSLCMPEQVVSIDNTVFSNGELWMECTNDDDMISIYRCRDWNTFQCEKILDLKMGMDGNGNIRMFSIMEKIGNKLLLLPGNYDKAYIFNITDRTVYIANQYPTVSCDKLRSDWFSAFNYYKGLRLEGKFLVIHSWTQQLIEVSESGDDVKKVPIIFSDETLDRIKKNEFKNTTIFNEGILDLDDFLHYVCLNER